MTSPLSQLLTYDLEQTLARLREAATRHSDKRAYFPRDLMAAAVAFTVQLAIESGRAANPLQELQKELIAGIEATKLHEERDRIITLREKLLAMRLLVQENIDTLPAAEQKLFQDCNIALGVVRSDPELREEAWIRVLGVLELEDQLGGVLPYIPAPWGFIDTDSGETPAPEPAKSAVEKSQ